HQSKNLSAKTAPVIPAALPESEGEHPCEHAPATVCIPDVVGELWPAAGSMRQAPAGLRAARGPHSGFSRNVGVPPSGFDKTGGHALDPVDPVQTGQYVYFHPAVYSPPIKNMFANRSDCKRLALNFKLSLQIDLPSPDSPLHSGRDASEW